MVVCIREYKPTFNEENPLSIVKIIGKIIPRILTHRNYLILSCFIFLIRSFRISINEVCILEFVKLGISKVIITNAKAFGLCLSLIWSILLASFLKTDKIMKYLHYLIIYSGFISFLRYLTLLLYQEGKVSKDGETIYKIILIIECLDSFQSLEIIFFISYFTKIAEPLIGGTVMTFFLSVFNIGGNLPRTMALKLAGSIDIDIMVIINIGLLISGLLISRFLATYLDSLDRSK